MIVTNEIKVSVVQQVQLACCLCQNLHRLDTVMGVPQLQLNIA